MPNAPYPEFKVGDTVKINNTESSKFGKEGVIIEFNRNHDGMGRHAARIKIEGYKSLELFYTYALSPTTISKELLKEKMKDLTAKIKEISDNIAVMDELKVDTMEPRELKAYSILKVLDASKTMKEKTAELAKIIS